MRFGQTREIEPYKMQSPAALLTLPGAQPSPGAMGFGGACGSVILPWDIMELFLDRGAAA